jgi:homopolymeric O-antigen transport system permease protein
MSLRRRVVHQTQEIARFRHLVRYLVGTSLRTENAGTVFGFVWWLLDPLLSMAVYFVLIALILDRGGEAYPVFVLTALIAFEFFSTSTRNSMSLTLAKERAMRQVAFPRGVIPLAATLAETVHLLLGIGVLLVFATLFGIYPSPFTPLVLPIALVELVFTLGIAYFLAALNIFFRDTSHLTAFLFGLWFYLSPSLYAATMVPDQYRRIFDANPFAILFTAYRDVLMYHQSPNLIGLAVLAVVSALLLLVGYGYFVRAEPNFAKIN